MILEVDLDSAVPIYQQLRDRVVEHIAGGELGPGDPLPSTRALAADLAVNFHTVRKAYELLRSEGLVRLNRRSGAVIARGPSSGPPQPVFLAGWREQLTTLLADAVAHGVSSPDVLTESASVLSRLTGSHPPHVEAS